jgi:hypothetical protein
VLPGSAGAAIRVSVIRVRGRVRVRVRVRIILPDSAGAAIRVSVIIILVMLCYVMVPLLPPVNCVGDSWGRWLHATSASQWLLFELD